jgi:AraC-like DNA-binding protein
MATKVRCADPVAAAETVSGLVEPRRFRICGTSRMADIRISHVATGFGHLFGVRHGAAIHATSAGAIHSFQVMVPLRGRLVGQTGSGEVSAAAGTALVYSPRDHLDTYWSEDCVALVLSVPEERLLSVARESRFPLKAPALKLRSLMSLRQGSGRSFANALGVICQESADPDSAFSRGLTARSLETTLLLALLLSQYDDGAPAVSLSHRRRHCVDSALDLIAARGDADLGIQDLVDASGASARTLQYAFMERFGVGPMTYLKQARLRRVREFLRAAQPGSCTVGDIAARWGFYNGSAFARAYCKMFGELPSRTLAG